MALELPSSSCKNRYRMDKLKCPPGSQSVVCAACMTKKDKPASPSSFFGSIGSKLKINKPSLTDSKEWPVVGMSKEQLAAESKTKKSTVAKPGSEPIGQYKCLDCGYRFSKTKQTKTTMRCPYCSRTRVQNVINLIQEVDQIGG